MDATEQRKADTRNKIELGGLVIKAGLNELSKAMILGILIEAKTKLEQDPKLVAHYQAIGNLEFSKTAD